MGTQASFGVKRTEARTQEQALCCCNKMLVFDFPIAHANAARGGVGNIVFVRDDDERHSPLTLDVGEDFHGAGGVNAIEIACRLIGQQDLRLIGQSPGDGNALSFPGRELAGVLIGAVVHAQFLKQLMSALGPVDSTAFDSQHGHLNILDGAQSRHQVEGLEDEADVLRTISVEVNT